MEPFENLNITLAKEFEIENEQMQFWFTTLKSLSLQFILLRDCLDQETKLHENIGKVMQNAVKNYATEIKIYQKEPSNLINNTFIFTEFIDSIAKIFIDDYKTINSNNQNFSNSVIRDISSLLINIKENSNNIVSQILEQRKNSNNLKIKYEKLKAELDEANMKKKKIEADPKRVYNVTMKEKAEQNILSLIMKMNELLPVIEICSKEIENKKNLFNKFMKETFELVISNLFKNGMLMIKTIFKIYQEKLELMTKLKLKTNEFRRKLRESDLNSNDYSEKKYAESQGIHFNFIDSITFNESLLDISLVKTIDDIQNYSMNFFKCMRLRKRALQPFAKFITEVYKGEEGISAEYNKTLNYLSSNFENFSIIGETSMEGWNIFKSAFDQNHKMHDLLGKFLDNNIFKMAISIIKETKNEYSDLLNNFIEPYTKEFSNYKTIILKYQKSKEKLITETKSIRAQINKENGAVVSRLESKLKSLQEEETALKNSYEDIGKKVKINITNSLAVLNKQTKLVRNKENNRLVTFLEHLESVIKTYEKIFLHNIEISKNILQISANFDIYADLRKIFENYFIKYKINNYESFFDKLFKKILINYNKNEVENIKEGKNLINNYINIIQSGRFNKISDVSNESINNYNSLNMNNFITNNNFNNNIQNNYFSSNKNLLQFNSNSSGNCVSAFNLKADLKLEENNIQNINEIELKLNNDKINNLTNNNNNNYFNIETKEIPLNDKHGYQWKINRISLNEGQESFAKNVNAIQESYNIENRFAPNIENDKEEMKIPRMSKFNANENYTDIKNNEYQDDMVSIKSDEINLNHKPDLNFLKENHEGNLTQPQLNFNHETNLDNLRSSTASIDESKIDFVNPSNFKFIEIKNPYNNIKENDLKEYMDKIKTITNDSPNNQIIIENQNQLKEEEKLLKLEKDEIFIKFFRCAFSEKILLQGRLYVTNKKLVFYSLFNSENIFFGNTKLIIPMEDIINVEKKKNLKIFDNSIKITTKKSELFFTSFVKRDLCFKIINEYWSKIYSEEQEKLKKSEEDNLNVEEVEINANMTNQTGNMMLSSRNKLTSKSIIIGKILKKMDFFNRLETLHKQRLADFESISIDNSNLQAKFKPEHTFKKIYFKEEPIGNCPTPLIFNSIFNNDVICEELEMNKNFWNSVYESRKDWDIVYEEIPIDDGGPSNDNTGNSPKIPKFFEDTENFLSLFSNIEEDNLNEFLDDISKWPKMFKFSYKFMHPIKKKIVGPDKLSLKEVYTCYFVSPKLFIVEVTCYGYNFPYSENFVTFSQYKFNTNYKFNQNEGIFKFNTSITLMFQIHFVKSCYFSGLIESEGYKESEENLRFGIYEKLRKVLDNQTENFNQHFSKLNDENIRRTTSQFFNKNSEYMSDSKTPQGNLNILLDNKGDDMLEGADGDNGMSESDNDNDKRGWKIIKSNSTELKSSYGGIQAFSAKFYKNNLLSCFIVGLFFYLTVTLVSNILTKDNISSNFSLLIALLLALVITIVYRNFYLK